MKTLRALVPSLGPAAIVAVGSLMVCGVAAADPGNGNGNANGLGNGNGNGAAKASPVAGTSPGNPHKSGSTGNPHAGGSTGNPHTGAPPYGVANGVGSGGSPTHVAPAPGGAATHSNNGHPGKTTICHSTGSATNPFVQITIANPAVQAHAKHHDGDDIIPAPSGGCSTSGPAANSPAAVGGAAGAREAGGTSHVLGAVASRGDDAPGDSPAADTAVSPKAGGTLPFTGLAIASLGSIGVVLLFGGWLVRAMGLRQDAR
jgi:hypothetical protein